MSFVLDTSTTMAWLFQDEANEATDQILDSLTEQEAWVPSLWNYEVGNVLVIAERRGRITEAQARHFSQLLLALPIQVVETGANQLWDGALTLARSHDLTMYDASYLDLAMKMGLPLATRDAALAHAARTTGVELLPT